MLTVEDLTVGYGGADHALHVPSLACAAGDVVAVLGANGAGKTTLLRRISCTLPRSGYARGRVELDGAPLPGTPAEVVRSGVVLVPEGRQIFGQLTVSENLGIGGFSSRASVRAKARERVLDLFPELRPRLGQRGSMLSGGEQQMLAIGRGLMASPRLLMLDEPTLGLAPLVIERISQVVGEIAGQGIAVLLVEQNVAIARVATAGLVLEAGRVVASGTAEQLARDDLAARYLGVSPATGTGRGTKAVEAACGMRTAPAPGVSRVEDARPIVEAEGLSVRFGGVVALREVSLEVGQGQLHAIIGPNGAGKTTLLNVLSGIVPPSSGAVRIAGTVMPGRRPHRSACMGVARAFQNLTLYGDRTVEDNLLLGRHLLMRHGPIAFASSVLRTPAARADERVHRRRVRELAEQLGIEALLNQAAGQLSYGDRKRVELARAVCMERPLLLLDEPVAGMNREEKQQVAETIQYCHTELGCTVVLVDHDMPIVMDLAQTVTVLDFGARIAHGTPVEVSQDPAVITAYLGAGHEAERAHREGVR